MAGYAEIAGHYRNEITEGRLAPGDLMPSYTQVAAEFQVNRTTAIRAYDVLKAEQLIASITGKGTTVLQRPQVIVTGNARLERGEAGGKHYAPGETSTQHEAWRQPCVDTHICRALGIERHSEVIVRRRIFRLNGTPTAIALNHIHPRVAEVVPEVTDQGKLPQNWRTTYTERTGRQINRSPELFGARHANADELVLLEITAPDDAAVPVLVSYSAHHDEDGPVTVWEDIYAPGTLKEVK
jgi:GntR family transcriptional regulator